MDAPRLAAAFASAFLAGAINSVAGGGTLVSFPVLLALGLPSVVANATSTAGIWPGTVGSIWGFRRELRRADARMFWLVIPSVVGGAVGATLLRSTPSALFDRLAPFLVLFASLLFTLRASVQRWLKARKGSGHPRASWVVLAVLFQLAVGVYGGYFGAGISIVMLSLLGILGMTDMLEMSGLTSLFSFFINGVAIAFFIAAKIVLWPFAVVMAIGALVGGYGAAGVARRVGGPVVRRFVIGVGFTMSAVLFLRMLR